MSIPISERGWKVLIHILAAREKSPFIPKEFMATTEAPIQYMVEKWLREGGEIKRKTARPAPEDLSIEDLEL